MESTRKELESEVKGWQGKLYDQMDVLRKKLDHETSLRGVQEHENISKQHQIERLQHQLDDAIKRLNLSDERIADLTASKNKAKERLREVIDERDYSVNRSQDQSKFAEEMRRVLEHEMDVRVKVEKELQTLQKLVDREMHNAGESRKALDVKRRELDDARDTNSRLEREIHALRAAAEHSKGHLNSELERKELDYQQLRDQLNLVTTQLERERELHKEQMREKLQELNHLQQELHRLQIRISELEGLLEKSTNKQKNKDGDAAQLRARILELEGVKSRLENEVSQMQNRMRTVDKDRERMIAAIHDLQSQVDLLQSKSEASDDEERTRLVALIHELQAQVETLRTQCADEHDHAARLACEVDETNSALDEVRAGFEKEMDLRKEGERLFEDEVNQWRAKEAQWERDRAALKDQSTDSLEQFSRLEKLQSDLEKFELELQERESIIEDLRERLADVEGADSSRSDKKSEFEEKLRLEVEGFQEHVKELCIQLEEATQKMEKETKARTDAEAGKKRLEKALLELNAKYQATPTKSDSQIASLKDQVAQLEDELARRNGEALDDFEFDPELIEIEDDDIEETDEHVRVKLSEVQRVLRKLHQINGTSHTRYVHEVEREETEQVEGDLEEEETVVEDEEEQEQEQEFEPNGHFNETTEEQEEDEEQEEQTEEQFEQQEEEIQEPLQEELDDDFIMPPSTPNGTKHVHFGTPSPSPPSTPPNNNGTSPPSSAPTTPIAALPSNDAERERLDNEWKRHVASSANKYTHSRIPLTSTKHLYRPSSAKSPDIRAKIENLRIIADSTPKTPEKQQGQAPGFYYVPVTSDEIDEELAKVVEETEGSKLQDIPRNFSRLDKGVYQFGLKKLHMQIHDGALVVRVGGGFMLFVEYLARHAKVENVKFKRDGMSFTQKRESVSKPQKKKTRQESSQNITTPSKWEPSSEEALNSC